MPSHESQLVAVAIASAAFGYWLATGFSSVPSSKDPQTTQPPPEAPSAAPTTPETPAVPPPTKEDPSTRTNEPTRSSKKKKNKSPPKEEPAPEEGQLDAGSDSEDERAAVSEASLAQVKPGKWEECKLVLVVNQELGMGKGKIAAQCGHATLACYKTLLHQNSKLLNHWEQTGQAKVAVKCTSTAELLRLQSEARKLNLCARSIQDAGRTQIAAGSRTVLGIGPGPVKLVNQVTGGLKLL
ncbi:hypothetical protein NCC49_002706 [Naganishia albida]|nr:hypothetical protein NCC49_002706 [Naganishia albida]